MVSIYMSEKVKSKEVLERSNSHILKKRSFALKKMSSIKKSSNLKLERTVHKTILSVQSKTALDFITIEEIIYCQANDNYTFIHLSNKKKLISKSLKQFQLLLEPLGFFRTSRSFLINLKHIESIKNGRKSEVVLSNDICIPISLKNKKSLIDHLKNINVISL